MQEENLREHDISEVISEQTLSDEDSRLLARIYGRLRVWSDSCRDIHDRAREARKIMLLQDPYLDDYTNTGRKGKRKTIQLQTLRSTVVNCIADQMDNMPEALMMPERADLQQQADDITDVVQYILQNNDYENIHQQLAEDLFVAGTGVVQVVWDDDMDDGEGNIRIIRVPLECLVWDPKCDDLQDGRAVMRVSWHPLSWYREHFPETGVYVEADNGQHGNIGEVMASEWWNSNDDEDNALLVEYWWREYNASTRRYKVNVAYAAGGALLEKRMNVYKHGRYPFEMCIYGHIEGAPVGEGLVMTMAPMMRYVDRYASYLDQNIAMSSKPRMLVNRSANLDSRALADWNQDMITGDSIGEDSVRWMQGSPLNNVVLQQMLQFQTDIKQDSGQNQFTRGETAGGVTAASAISALQEAGGKITRLNTQEMNQMFGRMVTLTIWDISQFFSGRKVRMVTGRDGKLREVNMDAEYLMGETQPQQLGNPEDVLAQMFGAQPRKRRSEKRDDGSLPPPPYSVRVQVQRRNPLRVQAFNENVLQAYQMAVQNGIAFPISTLFDMLIIDNKDKFMPRLQEVEAQSDRLQMALQQLQQVQEENANLKKAVEDLHESATTNANNNIGMMSEGLPVETPLEFQ